MDDESDAAHDLFITTSQRAASMGWMIVVLRYKRSRVEVAQPARADDHEEDRDRGNGCGGSCLDRQWSMRSVPLEQRMRVPVNAQQTPRLSMELPMTGKTPDQAAARDEDAHREQVRYPEGHVVGVVDTVDQVAEAANALLTGGFLDSEIDIVSGAHAADRLKESTGREGWTDLAAPYAQRIGLENVEMEMKAHYEQALRDDKFLVRVATPTDERRDLAKTILAEHGASAVNYFGKYTNAVLEPPDRG